MRYCSETEKKINFRGGACDLSWKYLYCIMTPWRNHWITGWQQYSSFYSLSRAPLEDDFLKEGAFCKVALMQSKLFSTLPKQGFFQLSEACILIEWWVFYAVIVCQTVICRQVKCTEIMSCLWCSLISETGRQNIVQIFRDSIQSFFCFYYSFFILTPESLHITVNPSKIETQDYNLVYVTIPRTI